MFYNKMKKLQIYSDGGSRGNPGLSAYGFLIFDENEKLIDFDAKLIGIATNNQAEYEGVLNALNKAILIGADEIVFFLDSELIVKQMNGEYKIKNQKIKIYKEKIDDLKKKLKSCKFKHIVREKNHFADKLLNIVLNSNK